MTKEISTTLPRLDVIIDEFSIAFNGVVFYRCPTEIELSQLFKKTARFESGEYYWDSLGVYLDPSEKCISLYLDHSAVDGYNYFFRKLRTNEWLEQPRDFNGALSINRNLLSLNPTVSEVKEKLNLQVTKYAEAFSEGRILDFQRFIVFPRPRMPIRSIRIECIASRLSPEPITLINVIFTFEKKHRGNVFLAQNLSKLDESTVKFYGYKHYDGDPEYWAQFHLPDDESLIALHGPDDEDIWLGLTNKRLLVQRRIIAGGRDMILAGDWELSRVRGLHVLPRRQKKWINKFDQQSYRVDLDTESVQITGHRSFFVTTRYYKYNLENFERFISAIETMIRKIEGRERKIDWSHPLKRLFELRDASDFTDETAITEEEIPRYVSVASKQNNKHIETLFATQPYRVVTLLPSYEQYSITDKNSERILVIEQGYFRKNLMYVFKNQIRSLSVRQANWFFRTAHVDVHIGTGDDGVIRLRDLPFADAQHICELLSPGSDAKS